MDEPITVFDLSRILLGDEPPIFLIEILFRTTVIYIYTLGLLRWIGTRSIAQLSLVEFLLVIALGSAVGDAMFYPDVPLLHCMAVITVVVVLDKGFSFLVARSARFENAVEGKTIEVVRNGRIQCREIERMNFGHEELFEQLRLKGIRNLGQVEAAFLESNGQVSVFRSEDDRRPGLSIFPPWDVIKPPLFKAGEQPESAMQLACPQCAEPLGVHPGAAIPVCSVCSGDKWHIEKGMLISET